MGKTECILATCMSEVREVVLAAHDKAFVGFDLETTGLDFAEDHVVGISVYDPNTDKAFYLPFAHVIEEQNLTKEEVFDFVRDLFKYKTPVFHGTSHDLSHLIRESVEELFVVHGPDKLEVVDTLILSTILQHMKNDLKTLAVRYDLNPVGEIITYDDLMARCVESPEVEGEESMEDISVPENFGQIDLVKFPVAVTYACQDAVLPVHLFTPLFQEYVQNIGCSEKAKELLLYEFDTEILLSNTTAHGFALDKNVLADFVNTYEKEVADLEGSLSEDYKELLGWDGVPPAEPREKLTVPAKKTLEFLAKKYEHEPFKGKQNPKVDWGVNSTDLVAHLLFNVLEQKKPWTKGGGVPSTKAEVLEAMDHPIAEKIIEYRSNVRTAGSLKGASAFIYPAAKFKKNSPVKSADKALIKYRTLGFDNVARIFSPAKESLQLNMDKRIRHAFVAPEGYEWIGFDWKQAELMLLALESKDAKLRDAINESDLHKFIATILFQTTLDKITDVMRDVAKTFAFLSVYCGFQISMILPAMRRKFPQFSDAQLMSALNNYFEMFKPFRAWVDQALIKWHRDQGWVTYFGGSKKHIRVPDNLRLSEDPMPQEVQKLGLDQHGRLALNTYAQNSVGVLLKTVYQSILRDECMFKNTIQHIPIFDAAYFLVRSEYKDVALQKLQSFASAKLQKGGFSVQMIPNLMHSEKSWGAMQKIGSVETIEELVPTFSW